MTIFTRQERSLIVRERRGLRLAAWIAAALVAACASEATEVTTANVGSVSITPASAIVSVGAQVPLQALVKDSSGRTITADIFWSVQSPSIATVSNAGVVTGVGLGSTQVAASVNGKSGIATITVERTPVTSVEVSPAIAVLSVLTTPTVQLTATAKGVDNTTVLGRTIVWSSDNASVATVDATGKVTAKGIGVANITATVVFDGVVSAIPATITVILP